MSVRADQISDLDGEEGAEPGGDSYRVQYLTPDGGGDIVVRAGASSVGIVDHAAALLREQGVHDARIRRIVPVHLVRAPRACG